MSSPTSSSSMGGGNTSNSWQQRLQGMLYLLPFLCTIQNIAAAHFNPCPGGPV
jgi:hypothetical protein